MTLAESARKTNYSVMSYYELVELEIALTWASEIIKSLLPVKKKEEMDALTCNYAAMSSKAVDEPSVTDLQSIERMDKTADSFSLAEEVKADTEEEDGLSLWDENNPVVPQNNTSTLSHKGKDTTVNKKSFVELALKMAKSTPVAAGIDPGAPYYMCMKFKKTEDGTLAPYGLPCGWNTRVRVLEKLKVGEKAHMEGDFKNTVKTTSAGDYMVYQMPGGLFSVSYYKMTGVELEPDLTKVPKEVLDDIEFYSSVHNWEKEGEETPKDDELETKKDAKEEKEADTMAEKTAVKSSIENAKGDPRSIAIIGTKDGETRKWNSYRECERNLGVGYGTASQVISGKMKSAKGWILKKVKESAE